MDNESPSRLSRSDRMATDALIHNIRQPLNPEHNITSIDGFFNRKRGRPPKNRFVEVYKNQSPQAIFTSFKLEKHDELSNSTVKSSESLQNVGIDFYKTLSDCLAQQQSIQANEVSTAELIQIVYKTNENPEKSNATNSLVTQNKLKFTGQHRGTGASAAAAVSCQDAAALFGNESTTGTKGLSVVRTKGTFYPEFNCPTANGMSVVNAIEKVDEELPQDLSVRTSAFGSCDGQSLRPRRQEQTTGDGATDRTDGGHAYFTAHLKLLLELYQQQQNFLLAIGRVEPLANTFPPISSIPPLADDVCGRNFKSGRQNHHTVPLGYLKFRSSEDCGYQKCSYRRNQSHFHCSRSNCHYGFCDRTRFVQHTARHERLDKLMGNDFQQFRSDISCKHPNCVYNHEGIVGSAKNIAVPLNLSAKKLSHFHCLKCEFTCSGTNKLLSHRRSHNKMESESIRSIKFRKVPSNEACVCAPRKLDGEWGGRQQSLATVADSSDCPYSGQTHYHCLICDCGFLTRSHFIAHRHKHRT